MDATAIPLGRDLFTVVDHVDAERVRAHQWHECRCGKHHYAYRRIGHGSNAPREFLHRFLLGLRTDDPVRVDHANGNGLDNRRGNLRFATAAENGRNRGPNRNNTSGYKRVCWHAGAGKWYASIQVDRQQLSLGLYADPVDAALAYDLAAIEHHGPFAWTNFLKREHGIPFATRAAKVDGWAT